MHHCSFFLLATLIVLAVLKFIYIRFVLATALLTDVKLAACTKESMIKAIVIIRCVFLYHLTFASLAEPL